MDVSCESLSYLEYCAKIPSWMMQTKTARVVGGAYAPFPIPWQVSIGKYEYPDYETATTEEPTITTTEEPITTTTDNQSHYIEVAQGTIFMEQNMRFGLILGRLAIMKKKSLGLIMSNS